MLGCQCCLEIFFECRYRMNRIKLITFDAMNTLFKVKHNVGDTYCDAIQRILSHTVTEKQRVTVQKNFFRVYKEFYHKYPNFGYGKISSRTFWHNIICYSVDGIGQTFHENDLKLVTDYLYGEFTQAEKYLVYPDVIPTLMELSQRGVKMGVVSNYDERLPEIIENLELKKYFQFVLCSRSLGVAKPDSRIFEIALSQLDVAPEQTLHVGDNIELDYRGAKSSGLQAVVINRTNEWMDIPRENQCQLLNDLLMRV